MFDDVGVDLEDFDSFQKIKRTPKVGKETNLRKSDYQIRAARRQKEREKQALLAEVDSEE